MCLGDDLWRHVRCYNHKGSLCVQTPHLVLVLANMLADYVADLPEAHPWPHRCNGLVQRLHKHRSGCI